MQSTMDLLAKAETIKDLSAWAKTLGLAKRTLYTAKYRVSAFGRVVAHAIFLRVIVPIVIPIL